jgi:hypothetical protein
MQDNPQALLPKPQLLVVVPQLYSKLQANQELRKMRNMPEILELQRR